MAKRLILTGEQAQCLQLLPQIAQVITRSNPLVNCGSSRLPVGAAPRRKRLVKAFAEMLDVAEAMTAKEAA